LKSGPDGNLGISVRPWPGSGTSRRVINEVALSGGRPCLVVPADAVVTLEPGGIRLPEIGRWKGTGDQPRKAVELPASNVEAQDEPGPVDEVLRLLVRQPGIATEPVSVRLEQNVPRLSRNEQERESPSADDDAERVENPWASASEASSDLVDRHVGFFHQLEPGGQGEITWQPAGGTGENGMRLGRGRQSRRAAGAVSLAEVVGSWIPWNEKDEPVRSIIVEIAQKASARIEDVCMRPRRVLSRQREMHPVGHVQEMDAGCLRWLIRQPGRTIAQKAGTRQQVLAITRFEDSDTPENRVLLDLLKRAAAACLRYVKEYRHYPGHQYIRDVRQLRGLVSRLRGRSPIGTVGGLFGLPQPNYVLQHDHRYRPLWQYYVKILRRQRVEDQIWRWRHRTWWEECELLLLSALCGMSQSDIQEPATVTSPSIRSDVYSHLDPVQGRFIDLSTAFDRWLVRTARGPTVVLFVEGCHWGDFVASVGWAEDRLAPLCPDAVLVALEPRADKPVARRVLGVWSLCEWDVQGVAMEERLCELESSIADVGDKRLRGLLLRPRICAEGENAAGTVDVEVGAASAAMQFALPAAQHLGQVRELLTRLLIS